MDLAGLDVEVDAVVGDQVAEPLGDAPQPKACYRAARGPRSVSPLSHCRGQWSRPAGVGCDLDSILILPLMMSSLDRVELGLQLRAEPWSRSRGTAPGRCRSFSKVPTYGALENDAVLAALIASSHSHIHALAGRW